MSGVFRGILLGAGGALGICSQTESLNDLPRLVLTSALSGYDKISRHHTSQGQNQNETSASSKELQMLSKQIAELKAANSTSRDNKPVVIYGGSSSNGLIKVVIITTTGVVVLYYFGYGFNDIMYVTKSTLSKAVKTLEENIGFIGIKLEKTRNEIFAKISTVEEMIFSTSKDLEQQIDVETGKIRTQIGELDGRFNDIEIGQKEIKASTSKMDAQMAVLQAKFDKNGAELEKANSGIKLLISSVMDLPHVQSNTGLMGDLRQFVSGYTSSWFGRGNNSDKGSSNGNVSGQKHGEASKEKVRAPTGLYNLTSAKN